MKYLFLLFSFLLFGQCAKAKNLLDSIYTEINLRNYEQAISIGQTAIGKSIDRPDLGRVYYAIAFCHDKLNEPSKAIENYLEALHSKNSEKGIFKANVLNWIAIIQKRTGLHEEAITHYTKALNLNLRPEKKGQFLINRSIAYKKNGQLDLAILDVLNAGKIAKELGHQKLLYDSYNQRGLIKKDLEDYDQAIIFLKQANQYDYRKKTYVNLGTSYLLKGEIDVAISYFQKAIDYSKSNYTRFRAYLKLGELYLSRNEMDLAFKNLKEAEGLFSKMEDVEIENIDIYNVLGRYYQQMDQNKKAYLTLQQGFDLQRKFYDLQQELTNKFQQVAVLKTEKEFRARIEREKHEESNQNKILFTMAISTLIIFLMIVLYRKVMIQKIETEEKNKLLKNGLKRFIDQL